MFHWLRRLRRRATHPASVKKRNHSFRPTLELLEDRWVPTGIWTWKGQTSDAWDLAANWIQPAGQNSYPGANNRTDDIAVFDSNATQSAKLTTDKTTPNSWASVSSLERAPLGHPQWLR